MKKWRCTICGYIHEGEAPPEECPLCKAPAEKFELVIEDDTAEESEAAPATSEQSSVSSSDEPEPKVDEEQESADKEQVEPVEETVQPEEQPEVIEAVNEEVKEETAEPAPEEVVEEKGVEEPTSSKYWKCTVCNYIANGDAPPKDCPICKAKPDKFAEVDAEGNPLQMAGPKAEKTKSTGPAKPNILARLLMALHLHPISVHMPNGILPIALIFMALAIFLGKGGFEPIAYFNLVAVLISMPLVLLTGFIEWKNRYQGAKTFIFFMKIFCSVIVTVSLLILVAWRFFDPAVATVDSPYRMIYFGVAVVMVFATALAGHLGGKLVFGPRDKMMKK